MSTTTTKQTDNTQKIVFELQHVPTSILEQMGGKASTLAKLLQLSFPVPPGISVLSAKLFEKDWQTIHAWVKKENAYPVAVRSSAQGEDGAEVSYAGQFKTFLNVTTELELVQAIQNCFESVEHKSSQSYAAHFNREKIPMRVLVQKMIQPKFSGVYFSHDPRNQRSSWMIEAVSGLGEQLVSGHVTPDRFFDDQKNSLKNPDWQTDFTDEISNWGKKVETAFAYQIDMEWAIDQNNKFWILQVRPITTMQTKIDVHTVLNEELKRCLIDYPQSTVWDGHSFAELSGVPSEMTYTIWRDAFKPKHAFDLALKDLGYSGVEPNQETQSTVLLDRIFGRSFLNLKNLEPVYFGQSPYKIIAEPRPHLEFDFNRMNFNMLLKAPHGLLQMMKVAWNIQTNRKEFASKALQSVTLSKYSKLSPYEIFAEAMTRDSQEQLCYVEKTIHDFTTSHLYGSFLITLLIESTMQGLLALLIKDLGIEKAMIEVQHFLGENLKTITSEMSECLIQAHNSIENWNSFVSRFGHRGLGELELSHARWIETNAPFKKQNTVLKTKNQSGFEQRKNDIAQMISAVRRPIFLQELSELQNLLQIREEIKMQIMKPYADIRWSLLALARNFNNQYSESLNLTENIFWLNFEEIQELTLELNLATNNTATNKSIQNWLCVLQDRKESAQVFKSIELPMSFSAQDLEQIFSQKPKKQNQETKQLLGVSLSPGVSSGVVHIVENPETEDLESWPENTILVAECTDPGWTPLFEKSKAIIVSRGGILSHCAIVAREMGLPAVGEIYGATTLFKEGEHVWVDGINGTIRRTN